jgi:hypothetical protein
VLPSEKIVLPRSMPTDRRSDIGVCGRRSPREGKIAGESCVE